MTSPSVSVGTLKQMHPEWSAWLVVVDEALWAVKEAAWQSPLVTLAASRPQTPRLADAEIAIRPELVQSLLHRLVSAAGRGRTPQLTSLQQLLTVNVDVLELFRVSLSADGRWVHTLATSLAVDAGVLDAVLRLLVTPFLMHVAPRVSVAESWGESYCPLCGAWPAFAEVRGIERRRFYRCGRCGCQWHAQRLRCPFCANDDHEALATLVADESRGAATVDACVRCHGYVKTFTRLQGCAPEHVIIEDLASVDLDIAAVHHGYTRPAGLACSFDLRVAPTRNMELR